MPDLNEIITPYLREDVDGDALLQSVQSYVESRVNDQTANVVKNKDDILNEKREIKSKFDELSSKYAWMDSLDSPITQESYMDMISQMDTLKTSISQNAEEFSQQLDDKYTAGKKAAGDTYEPKITALSGQLKEALSTSEKYKNQFENYQVENKLREVVSKLGIQSDAFWFNGLKASAKPQFGENGLESLTLPDANGTYLPLEDWSKSFVNSDQGKKMIPAEFNSGMEGNGSGSSRGAVPTLEQIAAAEPDRAKRNALYEKYGYA